VGREERPVICNLLQIVNPEDIMTIHISSRRDFIARIAGAAASISLGALAYAQPADKKPITLIVGWPAGGPSDNVARLAATHMAEALGRPIVIDNKAGAGGNIGTDAAARSPADGNTMLLATVASHGLNSALYPKLNHDPVRDFAPIGLITASPCVLLVPISSPYRTVDELVRAAKAKPGQLNYGSGGVGSTQHLAGASFLKVANIEVTHIPFKGTAPAMTELMAGRVDFILTTGAMPFVRSGKLRALAVTASQRLPALPEVRTFDELGLKGLHVESWYGLVAPAGTPLEQRQKLNAAMNTALQKSEVQKQFVEQGALAVKPGTPDQFWQFVLRQMPLSAEQVRISGAKAE
jgi:tripartite-type tricarboxylate transporter receptor subunit TctC